jgi:hypothetical protein
MVIIRQKHKKDNNYTVVVYCLLGSSPASECYKPKFRNTVSVPSSQVVRCE